MWWYLASGEVAQKKGDAPEVAQDEEAAPLTPLTRSQRSLEEALMAPDTPERHASPAPPLIEPANIVPVSFASPQYIVRNGLQRTSNHYIPSLGLSRLQFITSVCCHRSLQNLLSVQARKCGEKADNAFPCSLLAGF